MNNERTRQTERQELCKLETMYVMIILHLDMDGRTIEQGRAHKDIKRVWGQVIYASIE